MSYTNFCGKCGTAISQSDNFCLKCGAKKIDGVLPMEKTKTTRYGSASEKFGIIMGIILIIGSIYAENTYYFLLATSIFVINFVSLKTHSKSIKQLMSIINVIILAILIINWLKLYG